MLSGVGALTGLYSYYLSICLTKYSDSLFDLKNVMASWFWTSFVHFWQEFCMIAFALPQWCTTSGPRATSGPRRVVVWPAISNRKTTISDTALVCCTDINPQWRISQSI